MRTINGAQNTIDYWKANHNLGEKTQRFGVGEWMAKREIAGLESVMDTLIKSDNDPAIDKDNTPGVIECKDDGEIDRFQGDSKVGSFYSEPADGRIVCANFSEKAVDYLQITPKGDDFEALHQHFSREPGGESYMQIAGKIDEIELKDGQWLIHK